MWGFWNLWSKLVSLKKTNMPKEIQGRRVDETELIPGIRYWAKPHRHSELFTISSGVYSHKYYNQANIVMLKFVDVHSVNGIIDSYYEDSFSFRYWHPHKSLTHYYEIRTMPEAQKNEIKMRTRKIFEKRCAETIYANTEFPNDIAIHIAKFCIDE